MSYTDLKELVEFLRTVDEVTLLELLEIDSDDLVDTFSDKIADKKDRLFQYYHEEQEVLWDW